MFLRSIRTTAMNVAFGCYTAAAWVALSPGILKQKIFGSAGNMEAAFAEWVIGFFITAPISFPLAGLGWLLNLVFWTKPIQEAYRPPTHPVTPPSGDVG